MSQNGEVIIEWRLAPGHEGDAQEPADLEWSALESCPREKAAQRAAVLRSTQGEPGQFEFRVRPALADGHQQGSAA